MARIIAMSIVLIFNYIFTILFLYWTEGWKILSSYNNKNKLIREGRLKNYNSKKRKIKQNKTLNNKSKEL